MTQEVTGQFRIETEGLGTIVWQPDPDLIDRLPHAPLVEMPDSDHLGQMRALQQVGRLEAVARLLADVAEMLSLSLAIPDEWVIEQLERPGPGSLGNLRLPDFRAEAVWRSVNDATRHSESWFVSMGEPLPPHGQKLDATPVRDTNTLRLMQSVGGAR